MKPQFATVLTLALALATSAALASTAPPSKTEDAGWEEMGNDDGIQTWRKEIEGSPLVAFRGKTIVDASIAKVAEVLNDSKRKLEWVDRAVEAKDVRQISQYERVEYNRTSPPWPIKDRDFVFHAKAELDKAARKMTLQLKSIEDPAAPETNAVRGALEHSYYTLLCADAKCSKTELTVEIHADPKGSLPKWVVNLVQKSWPRKTLDGVRKQVAKPDVNEMPSVKVFFGLSS